MASFLFVFNHLVLAQPAPASLPGALDLLFRPSPDNVVTTIAFQADGRILAAGGFHMANNTAARGLARFSPDGTADSSFSSYASPSGGPIIDFLTPQDGTRVMAISVLEQGKIAIGGNFTAVGPVTRIRIAILTGDGTPDLTFDPGAGAWGGLQHPASGDLAFIAAIAQQPDAKLVIGGSFTRFGDQIIQNIARVNADGTLDMTFRPAPGISGGPSDGVFGDSSKVNCLALQSDNRILIGGSFAKVNEKPRLNLARLNPDGSLDAAFIADVGTSPQNSVKSIALQADGKIIVGGEFASINQRAASGIARLETDGRLDPDFRPGLTAKDLVHQLVLLSDGKILVVGDFSSVSGLPRNRVARLNSDGTLDATFNPNPGVFTAGGDNATHIYCVAAETDGDVLIGGSFTSVDGIPRSFLARLFGGLNSVATGLRLANWQRASNGFSLTMPSEAGRTYSLELVHSLAQHEWKTVQTIRGDGMFKTLTDSNAPGSSGFYRVRAE